MRKTLVTQMQEIKDYNLAKQISETESPSNQMLTEIQRDIVDIKEQQQDIKEEQHNINDRADGLGQYIRLNILEFWNFLYLVHPSKEDCAKKVIFFTRFLESNYVYRTLILHIATLLQKIGRNKEKATYHLSMSSLSTSRWFKKS